MYAVALYATFQFMSTPHGFAKFRKDRKDLTLNEVADLFGVDRTTILRWERSDPPVPVKRLAEIEEKTGIPRWVLRPDIFGTGAAA